MLQTDCLLRGQWRRIDQLETLFCLVLAAVWWLHVICALQNSAWERLVSARWSEMRWTFSLSCFLFLLLRFPYLIPSLINAAAFLSQALALCHGDAIEILIPLPLPPYSPGPPILACFLFASSLCRHVPCKDPGRLCRLSKRCAAKLQLSAAFDRTGATVLQA